MPEFIITRYHTNAYVAALREEERITELHLEKEQAFRIGNLYVGRIQSIVKNINAAFVDFGCGINGYLALDHLEGFYFTRQAREGAATCGDELLVQLEKEAIKTKLPVVTGNFNLGGRFCVLVYGQQGLNFSRKIQNKAFVKHMKQVIEEQNLLPENCALIVRTNAALVEEYEVIKELRALKEQLEKLLKTAPYRTCFSCLYETIHPFAELIRDYPMRNELQVITDLPDMAKTIQNQLPDIAVRLYQDDKLSLTALYSLRTAFERALSKHVWLKSGGDIVLEPTEALTVIDVNTGRNTDKNVTKENHFLRTNLEAAKEIAYQLRLRNYSGIILVDFIDMEKKENTEQLIRVFKQELAKDPVKAAFVDMTRLNLAEVTRKRGYRPLHEIVAMLKKEERQQKGEEV